MLTLGPALRGLGTALGASAAPRLDFRIALRDRLIEEAQQLALRPRAGPPRSRRTAGRGRSKGGGIRLAAIGIGFSLAGGGVVAAAHSLALPPKPATTAASGSTSPPAATRVQTPAEPAPAATPAWVTEPSTPAAASAARSLNIEAPGSAALSLRSLPSALVPSAPTALTRPSAVLSASPSAVAVAVNPPVNALRRPSGPVPTLLPTWLDGGASPSATASAKLSPLP